MVGGRVLDEAEAVVRDAKARSCRAFERIDPEGMVKELRTIYERERQRYKNNLRLRVTVQDPHNSLSNMKTPGILIYHEGNIGQPFAYAVLNHGPGQYVLQLPQCELRDTKPLVWDVVHDLLEPMGWIMRGTVSSSLRERIFGRYDTLKISIPRFVRLARPKNVSYANYGESSSEGRFVKDSQEITDAYAVLVQIETNQGHGSTKQLSETRS